jgi:hypothetical protein
VLSALHSIYMNKFDKKSLAIAAQLKKNQEAAASAAKGGAKDSGPAKAKRVIDAEATEVTDDRADDGADTDGSPADAVGRRARGRAIGHGARSAGDSVWSQL